VVGERDVVQVMVRVVGLERAPAAAAALHADDPFAGAGDGGVVPVRHGPRFEVRRAVHRHRHDGRVVDVGIAGVFVLECPAARTHAGPARRPVAGRVEDLQRQQPVEAASRRVDGRGHARFQQRMAHQRRVPHGRQAGLAIRFVAAVDEQAVDGAPGDAGLRCAEQVEHLHGIDHGREDAAQAVFAVQARPHERGRLLERMPAHARGHARREQPQLRLDRAEQPEPQAVLVRRARRQSQALRRREEQLANTHAARIFRARPQRAQHEQGREHGARPVRHLGQVERRPAGQQRDFHRHHGHGRPRHLAEQREQHAREDIALFGAAVGQDRVPGARHVRGAGRIADHLEGEIRLHAGARIERAAVEQRPAAVLALAAAQVAGDLAFQAGVGRFAQVVHHQHVFGRDGDVRLQFVDPVAVRTLVGQQGRERPVDGALQPRAHRPRPLRLDGAGLGRGTECLVTHAPPPVATGTDAAARCRRVPAVPA
jgi:hypothetical protein